jgi:diacylglycerol kinase family enzyme
VSAAVMAGAGFDARMIHDADKGFKDKAGRLAYVPVGRRT